MSTKTKSNEVIIAVIGLVGILITAGLSNWDKIFPPEGLIQAKFTGYRSTDNFETELRHYFNVSGARKTLDNMQTQMAQNAKMQLSSQFPEDSQKIKKIMDIAMEEAITLDQMLPKMIPIYKNHFTLQELQELNKFYSTEIMQNMIRKIPLLTQEAAPVQIEMITDFQKRYSTRLQQELN